jgi:hypothetical protein
MLEAQGGCGGEWPMADSKTRNIVYGCGALMVTICVAASLIHFNDWTKTHSQAVTTAMYLSGIAAIGCFLFWYFTAESPEGTPKSSNSAGRDVLGSQISAQDRFVHQGDVHYHGTPPIHIEQPTAPDVELQQPPLVQGPDPFTAFLAHNVWRRSTTGERGIFVWIENSVDTPTGGPLSNIYAVITYSEEKQHKAHVSKAFWLDHRISHVDIEVGERKAILIGTHYKNCWMAFENRMSHNPHKLSGMVIPAPKKTPFYFEHCLDIKCSLVCANTSQLIKQFNLKVVETENEEFEITLEQSHV